MSKRNLQLSIVIPAYNEAETITQVLDAIRQHVTVNYEVIVVDDGSSDTTAMKVKKRDSNKVHLIQMPVNTGKGAAIRTGIARARGEVIVIQDADLEYDPVDIERLIQPIQSGRADVVYGSRFVGGQPHRTIYFWNRVANGFLTTFSNILTNLNLTDMETGYKAFRRSAIQSLELHENDFGIEAEITVKLAQAGYPIYEIGISYYGRTYEDGKKIGPVDFFRAIWVLVKWSVASKI